MRNPLTNALARVLFAGVALAACEARAEVPAAPTRWVTDSAGFLSEAARHELDSRLESYERQGGHQILVWIGRTSGGMPLEDFTVRAFAAWKVGRKGLDDGLVLFVFADDRKVRIEVGYGLEGQVPDAIGSRIIQETILPRVKTGDHDGAIRDGVAALIAAIEGPAAAEGRAAAPEAAASPESGPPPSAGSARPLGIGQMILIGLAVIGFLILLATNPSLAIYLLFSILSGGRGGGSGGGGGGGFSGGGGRSGGGGASGSW